MDNIINFPKNPRVEAKDKELLTIFKLLDFQVKQIKAIQQLLNKVVEEANETAAKLDSAIGSRTDVPIELYVFYKAILKEGNVCLTRQK